MDAPIEPTPREMFREHHGSLVRVALYALALYVLTFALFFWMPMAATSPAPDSASADRAPSAAEKYIADWRDQPRRRIPGSETLRWRGPAHARAEIVVWGDLLDSNTADLDRLIRRLLRERPDVRYAFRHYPFDETCNPGVKRTVRATACLAAAAAAAAGDLGGDDGYWRMHEWLLDNQQEVSAKSIRAAAAALSIDGTRLEALMQDPAIAEQIRRDCLAARQLDVRFIPTLYVNGRCAVDRGVLAAVRQAYRDYLMHGRFPVYFLSLWLPPEDVDVNVHPTKSEVRFVQQRLASGILHQAVAQTLRAEIRPIAMRTTFRTTAISRIAR